VVVYSRPEHVAGTFNQGCSEPALMILSSM
jgi:hypothetical protein